MPRPTASVTIGSVLLGLAVGLASCSARRFAWQQPPAFDLADYHAAFTAAAGSRFVTGSTLAAQLDGITKARVLWLGDHHQSRALHRLQLELLTALAARGVRLALLLEAIGTADEGAVQDYLRGRHDLATLRARIAARWPESWLDAADVDADFYRSLLQFARQHGAPVRALEPAPRLPLTARDEVIAASVRGALDACHGRLLVVVVGQAHLGGLGDLPRRCGVDGVRFGGEPVFMLHTAERPPGELLRSDTGFWWFRDLLGDAQPMAGWGTPSFSSASNAATR